jgi:site-specific DNA-methyltransferase (adenine-specific)
MSAWVKREVIGNATLYLGDCLSILPALPKVDTVITDPPYGVGINYGENYDDKRKDYWDWMRAVVACVRGVCPRLVFTHRVTALRELRDWDWVGVWNKPGAFGSRLGNSCVLPHWEPIFMYGIHSQGVNSEYTADVFTVNPEPAKAGIKGIGREKWDGSFQSHPCPKPSTLYDQLVKAFAQNADVVVDPFMGSGTTCVSAMNLGKQFVGIEIEPKWFEQACYRLDQVQRQQRMFA